MKKLLGFPALGTGAVLLAHPQLFVRLRFGAEIGGMIMIMGPIGGTSLIGLGVAYWPGKTGLQPLYGMLIYSILAMLYLIRIGVRGAGRVPVVARSCGPRDPRHSSCPRAYPKSERRQWRNRID